MRRHLRFGFLAGISFNTEDGSDNSSEMSIHFERSTEYHILEIRTQSSLPLHAVAQLVEAL
jgi:hypothetical protein